MYIYVIEDPVDSFFLVKNIENRLFLMKKDDMYYVHFMVFVCF